MNISQQKLLVRQFLKRCNEYATDRIAEYQESLNAADTEREKALRRKIDEWTIYHRFNEHAIGELETSELDDWFEEIVTR
jgi:hypothetical protein